MNKSRNINWNILCLSAAQRVRVSLSIVVAIFGDVCTHGLLYSVGRLPDRATDRVAYKKPKVQKMTEITGLFEP